MDRQLPSVWCHNNDILQIHLHGIPLYRRHRSSGRMDCQPVSPGLSRPVYRLDLQYHRGYLQQQLRLPVRQGKLPEYLSHY